MAHSAYASLRFTSVRKHPRLPPCDATSVDPGEAADGDRQDRTPGRFVAEVTRRGIRATNSGAATVIRSVLTPDLAHHAIEGRWPGIQLSPLFTEPRGHGMPGGGLGEPVSGQSPLTRLLSASKTTGETNSEMSPPSVQISRTRLDEMKL